MTPRMVLVMRHGEKTDDPMDQDLADAGKVRADKLVTYIPAAFGKPDAIFASSISRHSARPFETVLPLSRALGVPTDTTYADNDYGALAEDILHDDKFDGKLVLVCWHHGNIPPLMHALGALPGDYPDPWDGSVFNVILRLDFDGGPTPKTTGVTEPF